MSYSEERQATKMKRLRYTLTLFVHSDMLHKTSVFWWASKDFYVTLDISEQHTTVSLYKRKSHNS